MTDSAPLEISIAVDEGAGISRIGDSVRTGIPLPRGLVRDAGELRLEDASANALEVQTRVQARWSDGSVQWVLVDTRVSINAFGNLPLKLKRGRTEPAGQAIQIAETPAAIIVNTGAAIFRVPRSGAKLVESVVRDGIEQLSSAGLAIEFRDGRGRERRASVGAARVEERGALRVAVALEGVIAGTDRKRPLEFVARLVFRVGDAVLETELTLRNPRRARHRGGLWDLGDPGSQHVGEWALVLVPAAATGRLRWHAEEGHPMREADGSVDWVLYQDSSGGEHWDSPNHCGADGKPTVSFRGYQVRGAGNDLLGAGNRATPCVELVSGNGAIACGMEGFWQNFPKALRHLDGRLQVALFPAETRAATELQGGEQKRHRLWFSFGIEGEGFGEIARCRQPLLVRLDPQAVEASHAIHGFSAIRPDEDPRYLAYMRTVIEGEHSFFAGREAIDEYGWRNFGDVYASHEAVDHEGAEPFISHYNNQYDVVHGLLMQGLRNRDARWFELLRDLARHVTDIDIYHTQDDKPAYNGGLFWHTDHHLPAGLATHRTYSRLNEKGRSYGGGPDNEHNYTTGLLNYHFLTGDPQAAEAVLSLAGFVLAMDDGSLTILGFLDKGPTGNASKTVSMDYHGPGRGAGNSINALLDAFWLTRERGYLTKAEELIQRCIHPEDDISALKLDEPEYRWSYLVFLQALGKYLPLKQDLGEEDEHFRYARNSLQHYAQWILENERPYSEQLEKVLLPTETWPAQDARKARVLATAAHYCTNPTALERMSSGAEYYQRRALADTLAFRTAHLVRPRVLLANYGFQFFHEAWQPCFTPMQRTEADPAARGRLHQRQPSFVSQRRRVVRKFRHLR